MPIYVFQCPTCGHKTERIQPYEAEAPNCTECADEGNQTIWTRMHRVPSSANFDIHGFKASNGYSGSHE